LVHAIRIEDVFNRGVAAAHCRQPMVSLWSERMGSIGRFGGGQACTPLTVVAQHVIPNLAQRSPKNFVFGAGAVDTAWATQTGLDG
jgi:hypothetical protein